MSTSSAVADFEVCIGQDILKCRSFECEVLPNDAADTSLVTEGYGLFWKQNQSKHRINKVVCNFAKKSDNPYSFNILPTTFANSTGCSTIGK